MARKFLVALDLGTNELQNAVIQNLPAASEPTGVTGRIYFDTTNNKLKVYNGSAWVNLATSGVVALGTDTTGNYVATIASSGGTITVTGSGSETAAVNVDLPSTGVSAGSYGSGTAIPTFTVDANGRLTQAGTASISTTLSIAGDTGTDSVTLGTDTLTVSGGEGMDVAVTNNTITIAGEDATTSNKGIASFASADFSVASGAVSISNVNLGTQTTGNYVATITGTANEIEVTGSGSETAAVTIGLPDNVTIGGTLTVTGDLTVNGTTTTLNTETLAVEDNIVLLNKNVTGSPASNAGIEVERGDSTNASFIWDESVDKWKAGVVGSEAVVLISGVAASTDITDFTEAAQDAVGGIVSGSNSLSVTYNDGTPSIVFDTTLASSNPYLSKTSGLAVDLTTLEPKLVTDGFTKKYSASVGNGSATSIAVTHSLGTRDVQVQVYDNATYDTVETDVVRTDANTVTVTFATAPSNNAYRVVVIG